MLFFRFPGGGSAKCFKNFLKQLLFFNSCFSIVVLPSSFAIVCCNCVLQTCFAIVCCDCVLQLYFANVKCNCVLQLCMAIVFHNSCNNDHKTKGVLTDAKAEEVLTDEKPKKS